MLYHAVIGVLLPVVAHALTCFMHLIASQKEARHEQPHGDDVAHSCAGWSNAKRSSQKQRCADKHEQNQPHSCLPADADLALGALAAQTPIVRPSSWRQP